MGKSINYEGATGVEFDKIGDTFGSFVEVDFNKGLGIASATFANVIIGKHGGAIKELGDKKLDEKKLYNAGTFQIVGSALNICPESIPKNIKNDYEKRLKQLVKQSKK